MNGVIITLAVAVAAVTCVKQCPSDQSTNWELELLLPHEDCDKFYKCTYGEPVPQACPTGLVYNIDSQQCDWKNEVDCGDRNDPTEEKEPESESEEEVVTVQPESESEEAVVTEQPESESEEAVVTEQPESESEEAVVPEQPESESEEAVVTEQPESESEEAVVTEQPESESEEDVVTEQPESESEQESESDESDEPSQPEFLENGCPVSPHIHWLLPSEEDCNQFYYCVFGEKKPRQCHSSLHFNPVLQVCDFPWDAGCQLGFNKRVPVRPLLTIF